VGKALALRIARTTSGSPAVVDDAEIEELRARIRGTVLRAGDEGYAGARVVFNGMYNRRPALIVRCGGTADVIAAVQFARERRLLTAVRAGGHSIAGNSTCDDGLVVDVSVMNAVHVDPKRRVARVQGGATWGDVDRETQVFGLATPGASFLIRVSRV
jgi:FAD/FMN-containing dehydrogenase